MTGEKRTKEFSYREQKGILQATNQARNVNSFIWKDYTKRCYNRKTSILTLRLNFDYHIINVH